MKMDRSLVTIFLLVVVLHASLILWAVTGNSAQQLVPPRPPLVVKTVALNPPKTATTPPVSAPKKAAVPPVEPKKTEPKKPVVAEAKPTPQKKPVVAEAKTTPPKKTPPPQKQTDDPLLTTARQALKDLKLATSAEPVNALTETPSHASATPSYEQTLGQRLHKLVRLPEYGEVTIQLTLARNGTVSKVEVLAAESNRNREYIERQLPNLRFPLFGTQYPKEETHTFTLVLKNE